MPVESLKKRLGGIAEQMPSVGHLDGARGALTHAVGICPSSIARDDRRSRVLAQPCRKAACIAIWQEVDDASLFEVTEDRPVALTTSPSPIVDAEHTRAGAADGRSRTPDQAKQAVGTQRGAKPGGQS